MQTAMPSWVTWASRLWYLAWFSESERDQISCEKCEIPGSSFTFWRQKPDSPYMAPEVIAGASAARSWVAAASSLAWLRGLQWQRSPHPLTCTIWDSHPFDSWLPCMAMSLRGTATARMHRVATTTWLTAGPWEPGSQGAAWNLQQWVFLLGVPHRSGFMRCSPQRRMWPAIDADWNWQLLSWIGSESWWRNVWGACGLPWLTCCTFLFNVSLLSGWATSQQLSLGASHPKQQTFKRSFTFQSTRTQTHKGLLKWSLD